MDDGWLGHERVWAEEEHCKVKLPLNAIKGQPGFKIGHLNVRSLVHKIDLLRRDLPNSGFTFSQSPKLGLIIRAKIN